MPNTLKTFRELNLNPLLKNNLEGANFTIPTPVQAKAIVPALEGRDILGTAQTGTGKTLAFLLPIMEMLTKNHGNMIEALVLAPTRELAMQILAELKVIGKGSGVPTALVVGGLAESKQLERIRHGARIVIATPGRLDDYIRRNLVNLKSVKILVLDEADRMVDMGFLPQMRNIMNSMSQEHQTMCFSATLDSSVEHLVRQYLKNPTRIEIGSTLKPAELVTLKIYEVSREQKVSLLSELLQKETGTFLIFTRTKYGADKLVRKLIQRGFDASVLHGGKTQSQRIRALEGFKAGKHRILVATDIAARGIHVEKIQHVVNYDMPQALDDFIHRVGRTGRVDEKGTATTFVAPEEVRDIQLIERRLGKKIERLSTPEGLPSEPRSLHDEAINLRGRPRIFRGRRHFGKRRF